MADPLARGPIAPVQPVELAGWVVDGRRANSSLTLVDCAPLTKIAVRADPDATTAKRLAVPFGSAGWTHGLDGNDAVLVVGIGPGEWLVLGSPATQATLAGELDRLAGEDPAELVTVVDLTHGRALVRLTGPDTVALLARECAVDLADHVAPDGSAMRTAVAGLAADIVRDDKAGARSYLVGCERSSGQYLADCLLEAGADLGVEVDGFSWPPG